MALIPPHFVDSVVAIGNEDAEGEKRWSASGFLYGTVVVGADESGGARHRVYLVTNRHVLGGNEVLYLRCNPAANAPARDYPLVLRSQRRPVWFGHPDPSVDVGVVPIKIQKLRADGAAARAVRGQRGVGQRALRRLRAAVHRRASRLGPQDPPLARRKSGRPPPP
jgi:hypothetical protein